MADRDIAKKRRNVERFHQRTKERRAAGLCLKCCKAEPAPDRTLCEHCLEKRRAADLARSARLGGNFSVSNLAWFAIFNIVAGFRSWKRNSGGSSAWESFRHAASKRPDFRSARKVRIGCPVPSCDHRIPAPFMRLYSAYLAICRIPNYAESFP